MNDKKVLIVEDEIIPAKYLKSIIEKANFTVIDIVDNANEAISIAKEKSPDLILMDIMLKGKTSGSEAAITIYQQNPRIKIIFLTAYSNDEMIDYAIDAHSFAYLMKPYREKEIINTIRLTLSQHSNDKENNIIKLSDEIFYNKAKKLIFKNKKELYLKPKCQTLINLLCDNIDNTVSYEQLSHHIWGDLKNISTIRTLVHRTKEQLPDIIKNINNVGYMITSS